MMTIGAARQMHWTEADYLAFENESATKHEYLNGEIFAIAGAKPSHNQIANNTSGALHQMLRGRRCRGFNSDQRIYIPQTGLYTYSDGGVACGRWQIHTDGTCLLNPVLLFEVLSPATRDYDRGAKRDHYHQIPTLRHLLLIDQPTRLIEHYHREPGELGTSLRCTRVRSICPTWVACSILTRFTLRTKTMSRNFVRSKTSPFDAPRGQTSHEMSLGHVK